LFEHDPLAQEVLDEQYFPKASATLGATQARFESVGTPMYPEKHDPQVFDVLLQGFLFKDLHGDGVVQSTTLILDVTASMI